MNMVLCFLLDKRIRGNCSANLLQRRLGVGRPRRRGGRERRERARGQELFEYVYIYIYIYTYPGVARLPRLRCQGFPGWKALRCGGLPEFLYLTMRQGVGVADPQISSFDATTSSFCPHAAPREKTEAATSLAVPAPPHLQYFMFEASTTTVADEVGRERLYSPDRHLDCLVRLWRTTFKELDLYHRLLLEPLLVLARAFPAQAFRLSIIAVCFF